MSVSSAAHSCRVRMRGAPVGAASANERVKSLNAPAMSLRTRATGPWFTSFTSRNVSDTRERSPGSPLVSQTRYCATRAASTGIGMA